jgi:2-methylcitrate dehydratase PrpD
MGQQIEDLAGFVAATRWEDIPTNVQAHAKLTLLDIMGIILAGNLRPEIAGLRDRLTASGGAGATVLSPALPSTDPRTAAMINAIAGRAIELCDGIRGQQPSVQIVPSLLALGEQRGSTGKDVLTAYVAGYEVAGRLSLGFTPRPFAHGNGQLALLACAAAGARLQGFDAAGVSQTMRIATSMLMTPSYTSTAAGATTLNLPAGMSGAVGVLAPDLTLAGFTAKDDAIEEALGTMVGAAFDPVQIVEGLGDSWQIAENYFRFYACCNPIHPALDCLIDVLAVLRPDPAAIERIDVVTHAFASVMRNPDPPNYFGSKYSLPHAAAVLVVRGGLRYADIDDGSLADPAIAALRHRVHIVADPEMSAQTPALRPARVTVTLRDGRQESASRRMSRRDEERPDPEPEVRAKFHDLAGTVLTDAGVKAVEQAIDHAEDLGAVAELIALFRRYGRGLNVRDQVEGVRQLQPPPHSLQ